MKKAFAMLVFVVALVSFMGCSSTNKLVKATNAFYVVRLPGIIAVDETGSALPSSTDTTNFVYVETAPKDISWNEAIISGKRYTIIGEKVEQPTVFIGTDKQTLQPTRLTPNPPHFLWRLTFTPAIPTKFYQNKEPIRLTGQAGRHLFTITIPSRREIDISDLPQ